MTTYSDDWDGDLTVVIERCPSVPRPRSITPTYFPPPAGRHDNDRPTLTDLPAIKGDDR